MKKSRRPREVFLSHSSEDDQLARLVKALLEKHGIRVWFSPHRIHGGGQWQNEIGKALARCDWLIVVLTPNAVASKWVKRELEYAFALDRYDNRILPLLFSPCNFRNLSWMLPQIQMIDFANLETGCRVLLRTWKVKAKSSVLRRLSSGNRG